ncbi:protein ALP1-like isoform X2 [Esox lucius]|uniref:protein ALP1-like isoform X2 n=1 Tax=Esox lucius TaxID=8010 RepID=UPI0014770FA7|nr:protein ALP1-like isoform X2 [Esox lucius]
MDNSYAESAGRAVLEMMQREWEPLSQGELDQRLDQAVEDILEANLLSKIQGDAAPINMQLSQKVQEDPQMQNQIQTEVIGITVPPVEQESEAQPSGCPENSTVQYIMNLLQNSNSKYNQSRMAGRARLSLSHTVLLSLTLLSKRLSYRSVSTTFRLEKGNIHRIFFSFCERVNILQDQKITWPTGINAVENLPPLSSLLRKARGLEEKGVPRVLGVLGHTRIPIRLPIGKQDVESMVPELKRMKREAHPDSWLNLELVCNHKGRLMHCRISKGSDLDRASNLRDKLKQHPEMVPPGTCLVARVGYPASAQILTPYVVGRGSRENLYNRSLEAHFEVLDQAVADLKARFQRLRYLDMGNYERAKAVVLTACILHNVFIDMGDVRKGQVEREAGPQEDEEEGDCDEEGVRRREAIADLLYKELESGTT